MSASRTTAPALLEQEDAAWRGLPPAGYDRAVRAMFEALDSESEPADRAALLDLSEAILGRDDPALAEAVGCAAGHLLALIREAAEPDARTRGERLFLLAWQQLCAAAARGPELDFSDSRAAGGRPASPRRGSRRDRRSRPARAGAGARRPPPRGDRALERQAARARSPAKPGRGRGARRRRVAREGLAGDADRSHVGRAGAPAGHRAFARGWGLSIAAA